jgi:hypothetical protein
VAEALAEELWMIEEFRSAVAHVAEITVRAGPRVVELIVARLSAVGRSGATLHENHAAPVALAVEEGATPVVV